MTAVAGAKVVISTGCACSLPFAAHRTKTLEIENNPTHAGEIHILHFKTVYRTLCRAQVLGGGHRQ